MTQLDEISWPAHSSLLVQHNMHRNYYETVQSALQGQGACPTYERTDFPDESEIAKSIATDSVWTIQWYPGGAMGFHRVHAATLARALAHALACP